MALLQSTDRAAVVDSNALSAAAVAVPSQPKSPLKAEVLAGIGIEDMQWRRDATGSAMMLTANIANESWFDVKDVEVTCSRYSEQGTKVSSNQRVVDGVILKAGRRFALVSYNMGPIDPGTTGIECRVSNLALVGMWPGWIADNQPNAPETIKEMQRRLASRGFYIGAIDGVIGPKTRAAIEKFEAYQQEALDPATVNASLSGRLSLD